ncbi:S-layer homology domain-containing protein, partial [bacterium]|nr:S-layer homology domain-containing protein [bacterium]
MVDISKDVIDVATLPGFSVTGTWQWSSKILGPIASSRSTIWNNEVTATATWNPEIYSAGQVRVAIYKVIWTENNDPSAKYEIVHNDKTDTIFVDHTKGETGWHELGTFDFVGEGDEYVRLVKVTEGFNTRASAVRFEILNEETQGVWQSLYVNTDTIADTDILEKAPEYSDIAEHPAAEAVAYLARRNMLKGVEGDAFRPDEPITGAEAVAFVVGALGLATADQTGPAADFIPLAGKAGLLESVTWGRDAEDLNKPLIRAELNRLLEHFSVDMR